MPSKSSQRKKPTGSEDSWPGLSGAYLEVVSEAVEGQVVRVAGHHTLGGAGQLSAEPLARRTRAVGTHKGSASVITSNLHFQYKTALSHLNL